jgi:hypothetical protein
MASVFISHRGSDTTLAERLGSEIRAAGHQVALDAWDVHVGDSIIQWMDDQLGTATHVVVGYSSAGVAAPWMSREWMAALSRQLNGRGGKLLPVRLSGGEPPAILDDLKYADLVSDWATGVADLLRALR